MNVSLLSYEHVKHLIRSTLQEDAMVIAGQPLGKLLALLALIGVFVLALVGQLDVKLAALIGVTDLAILLL
jgi:hypothetical protein